MASAEEEGELEKALLTNDHNADEPAPAAPPEPDGTPSAAADQVAAAEQAASQAAEQLAGTVEAGDGEEMDDAPIVPPQHSALSRQASLTSSVLHIPDKTPSRLRPSFVQKTAGWFGATLLFGMLTAVGLIAVVFPPPGQGAGPACRTSAAIAVIPGGNHSDQRLVVWSGMGTAAVLFHDVHSFSLSDMTWRKEKAKGAAALAGALQPAAAAEQQLTSRPLLALARPPAPEPPLPLPRWKAAAAQLGSLGMMVHGGSTLDKEGAQTYQGDAWLLGFPRLRWQQASSNGSSSSGEPAPNATYPCARRSHSLVTYQDEEGNQMVLLFGGRRQDGLLLNDVWAGRVDWPNIDWTLLNDPQAGEGSGPAPLPRKGHVAVMYNNSAMIVHGGRSEVYGFFTDVWSFDPTTRRWTPLPPTSSVQPAPRDGHGAALSGGRLFIFGGATGTTYDAPGRPIGDRWLFDLQTRAWWQLPIRGLSPLPRFLFSSTQYTPAGGGADQFLVFGGETGYECKLNDVWRLDLSTLRWSQLSTPYFATPRCAKLFGS